MTGTDLNHNEWWRYDKLPSIAETKRTDWHPAARTDRPWDQLDFHLDLGCGRVPKARIGIDLRPTPGATDLAIDLNTLRPSRWALATSDQARQILASTEDMYRHYSNQPARMHEEHPMPCLPFPDESIKSIISHHAMEHIGDGFQRLMEECYRILEWGGVMRVIVPLFPSTAAVGDYDHKRYFMEDTWIGFTGVPNGTVWSQGFAEPYNSCRFRIIDNDCSPPTPPERQWTPHDQREMRVTLWKWRGPEPSEPRPESYPCA